MVSATAPLCPKCGEAAPVSLQELHAYEQDLKAAATERQRTASLFRKIIKGALCAVAIVLVTKIVVYAAIEASAKPRLPKECAVDLGLGDGVAKVQAAVQGGTVFHSVGENSYQRIGVEEVASDGEYLLPIRPPAKEGPWSHQWEITTTLVGGHVNEIHAATHCSEAAGDGGLGGEECSLGDWELVKASLWSHRQGSTDRNYLGMCWMYTTAKWTHSGWQASVTRGTGKDWTTGYVSIEIKTN